MITDYQWLGIIIVLLNLIPLIINRRKLIYLTSVISIILIGLKMGGLF